MRSSLFFSSLCFLFSFEYLNAFLSVSRTGKVMLSYRNDGWQIFATEGDRRPEPKKKDRKPFTLKDLRDELLRNPASFDPKSSASDKKKSYRRTRKRVENPQQRYLYKAQREALEKAGQLNPKEQDASNITESLQPTIWEISKEMGMVPAAQHCDPLVDTVEPRIVGRVRVSDETNSAAWAYIIDKPAGWSILGAPKQGAKAEQQQQATQESVTRDRDHNRQKHIKRVKVFDEEEEHVFEWNELDVMGLLTPEELEEYRQETGEKVSMSKNRMVKPAISKTGSPFDALNDDDLADDNDELVDEEQKTSSTATNLRRIMVRSSSSTDVARFANWSRPSVVSWLKDLKAAEGTPIRGGNFWTALAGAVDVDDSGLVLLCPKANTENVFVDYVDYIAVVGNGGNMVPNSKIAKTFLSQDYKIETMAKLRTGREDDAVEILRVSIPEVKSTCASIVGPCQTKSMNGIRGDPAANPFDRRAYRRLIHSEAMSVSSLIFDENVAQKADLPDDISVLANRRNELQFKSGSFLGRRSLRENPLTNAYREINGAADGHPGWFVDRYDKWLFVQHDPAEPRGPLPSIHDGNTLGVYYLEMEQDRSKMGSVTEKRPILLEGKAAPDFFEISENGIKYIVSLDRDLSTGIFLDQRPQRAWLSRNCSPQTHLLNCFAHTGAFSVAAATAGASTVSLDLSKKWLDRLPEHLKANGIPMSEKHDCIYGDCFDWLSRLAKRGEKFDVVVLDPPSTSVGGRKKKRWSVKNDMDELVSLAAGLVKKGGYLWTTTNSASIHPIKFARLCRKGLDDAGFDLAKLERIQPMPTDFQSIGPPRVKNLVWKLP